MSQKLPKLHPISPCPVIPNPQTAHTDSHPAEVPRAPRPAASPRTPSCRPLRPGSDFVPPASWAIAVRAPEIAPVHHPEARWSPFRRPACPPVETRYPRPSDLPWCSAARPDRPARAPCGGSPRGRHPDRHALEPPVGASNQAPPAGTLSHPYQTPAGGPDAARIPSPRKCGRYCRYCWESPVGAAPHGSEAIATCPDNTPSPLQPHHRSSDDHSHRTIQGPTAQRDASGSICVPGRGCPSRIAHHRTACFGCHPKHRRPDPLLRTDSLCWRSRSLPIAR